MSTKEVLRTTPPVGVQYVTWCNDCEEAVTNDDASCVECASLDLEYFIRESDHLAAMAEKDAEIKKWEQSADKQTALILRCQETIATQAEEIVKLKANADQLRSEVGECHLMISRNDFKYQTEDNWRLGSLPQRFVQTIASQARVIDLCKQAVHWFEKNAFTVGNRIQAEDFRRQIEAIEKAGAKDE